MLYNFSLMLYNFSLMLYNFSLMRKPTSNVGLRIRLKLPSLLINALQGLIPHKAEV
jgi:hypothetical protein